MDSQQTPLGRDVVPVGGGVLIKADGVTEPAAFLGALGPGYPNVGAVLLTLPCLGLACSDELRPQRSERQRRLLHAFGTTVDTAPARSIGSRRAVLGVGGQHG